MITEASTHKASVDDYSVQQLNLFSQCSQDACVKQQQS